MAVGLSTRKEGIDFLESVDSEAFWPVGSMQENISDIFTVER